jgi:hypothetical protein
MSWYEIVRALTDSIPWRDARWLPTTTPHLQLHILDHLHSSSSSTTFARANSISKDQLTLPPHVLVFVPTISPSCCREPYLTPSEDCCPCTSPSLTRARRLYLARCVLSSFFVSIFIFPFPSSKVRAAFTNKSPGGWATLLCDFTILRRGQSSISFTLLLQIH